MMFYIDQHYVVINNAIFIFFKPLISRNHSLHIKPSKLVLFGILMVANTNKFKILRVPSLRFSYDCALKFPCPQKRLLSLIMITTIFPRRVHVFIFKTIPLAQ